VQQAAAEVAASLLEQAGSEMLDRRLPPFVRAGHNKAPLPAEGQTGLSLQVVGKETDLVVRSV
jgi:hypothetical protein